MYSSEGATVGVGGEMDHAPPPSSAFSHLTPSLPRRWDELFFTREDASKCKSEMFDDRGTAAGWRTDSGGWRGGGGDGLDGPED